MALIIIYLLHEINMKIQTENIYTRQLQTEIQMTTIHLRGFLSSLGIKQMLT